MTLCPYCSGHKKIISETIEAYHYPFISLEFSFKEICPLCGKTFNTMNESVELNILENFYDYFLDKFRRQINAKIIRRTA